MREGAGAVEKVVPKVLPRATQDAPVQLFNQGPQTDTTLFTGLCIFEVESSRIVQPSRTPFCGGSGFRSSDSFSENDQFALPRE